MLLTYIYLLRVPLLGGLLLAALPFLALGNKDAATTTFLEGLFDVGGSQHALVTVVALLCASACAVSTEIVLRYACLRFHVHPLPEWLRKIVFQPWGLELTRATLINVSVYAFCAVPTLWGIVSTNRDDRGTAIAWVLAGLVFFALLATAVAYFWSWSLPATARWLARVFVWTPKGYIQSPRQRALTLQKVAASSQAPPRIAQRQSSRARQLQHVELLLGGHGFAAVSTVITLVFYALFGFITRPSALVDSWVQPLPLTCLLFLITLLVYVLGGAAFLLDRFRLPTAAAFALVVMVSGDWPQSDHYFATRPLSSAFHPVHPQEFLKQYHGQAVAVAASGGGIQAAAWMTAVLSRLNDETQGTLAPDIAVISSVSGGSTGAMYFLNAYDNPRQLRDQTTYDQSATSSLEDVAWGFIYPDFWRLLVPFAVQSDRGITLEEAWKRAKAPDVALATWRDGAGQPHRPAAIFNATLAETGGRLLMSTTDLPPIPRGRRNFYTTYPDVDISVVTAARLSATFPYVSPAARIDKRDTPLSRAYHVVDGGYFDNFGVASLNDWLLDAIPLKSGELKRLLVLRILGPESAQDSPAARHRGFFYQTTAPLSTLLSFRTTGQVSRNNAELKLLAEALKSRGVDVTCATFEYPFPNAPLSWHLTVAQREATWSAYEHDRLSGERRRVREFMTSTGAPDYCADITAGLAPQEMTR